MDVANKIDELGNHIATYHKMMNYYASWFLLATISAWSLSYNHRFAGLVAVFLIVYFYMKLVLDETKKKFDGKLIVDGWNTDIKKAINMLEAEIRNNCEGSEQQEFLKLLQERCSSQIRCRSIFKHRAFWAAYLFFAWACIEMFFNK